MLYHKKKVAIFDIDGTLFRSSLHLMLIHELNDSGYFSKDDTAKINHALINWKDRSGDNAFWNYVSSVTNIYNKELSRLSVEKYKALTEKIFDKYKDHVYKYPQRMISVLKKQGYKILALSGSQEEMISLFCQYHGFDGWSGSIQEIEDGKFNGNILSTHDNKLSSLNNLLERHGLDLENSIGIGDTLGDLEILQSVTYPIAFNPNKELYEFAQKNSWDIVIERKDLQIHLKKQKGEYKLNQNLFPTEFV